MSRKKRAGQKRAKKVQARKERKEKRKARGAEAGELTTEDEMSILKQRIIASRTDNKEEERLITKMLDQRVIERKMAEAAGYNDSMTISQTEADDLFLEALNTIDLKERHEILLEVLEINPLHIDALLELSNITLDNKRSLRFIKRAIAAGNFVLFDELEEEVGHFWGMLNTRPYMRAKQALAQWYFRNGKMAEATREIEEMLVLNPEDNQGMRWLLMEIYCREDNFEAAEKLRLSYPDESLPFLPFTGLLIRFSKEGDSEELKEALREQAERNPHIIPRLLDPSLIDHVVHEFFQIGSTEEADLYCQQFLSAWKSTPGAITWLRAASYDLPVIHEDPLETDIEAETKKLLKKVANLDETLETWFCDASELFFEDDDEDKEQSWMLTLINLADDDLISTNPGENPLGPETVFYELLNAMLMPDDTPARKPAVIQFIDAELQQSLSKRLDQIGIESEVVDEAPELFEFMQSVTNPTSRPVEFDPEEISEVPATKATWEVDWREMNQRFPDPDTGESLQPWMILVADHKEHLILGKDLLLKKPSQLEIMKVIGQAVFNPMVGEPARPAIIRVPSAGHLQDIKPAIDEIGIECGVSHCQVTDNVFEILSKGMEEEMGGQPAMISHPGTSPAMIGDFFDASALYYKSRLWKFVHSYTIIEVRCSELTPKRWYIVTMGQMGEEIGLMFFDDRKILQSMFSIEPNDPAEGAAEMRGIGYSLNEEMQMAPEDVAAAEQFGWPVPAPEAWPSAFFVSHGEMRQLEPKELQFVSAAIPAIIKQYQAKESSLEISVELHDRTVQVSTSRSDLTEW